jgi:hypothetical protein
LSEIRNSYVVHWSNKDSASLTFNWNSDTQPISVLARKFCPVTSDYARNTWSMYVLCCTSHHLFTIYLSVDEPDYLENLLSIYWISLIVSLLVLND